MKTDDLVKLLAADGATVPVRGAGRHAALALGAGTAGSLLLMLGSLGVRPDLAQASLLPMFWAKLIVPLLLAGAALAAARRLARPGMGLGAAPFALAATIAVVWLYAAMVLLQAPAGARAALLLGSTWAVCPWLIALISVPTFIASCWTMRSMAPTRPALAGAAAGLLAGAVATTIYALHCPEMQAPFLALWYLLGMLVPAGAGALLGGRLLRW